MIETLLGAVVILVVIYFLLKIIKNIISAVIAIAFIVIVSYFFFHTSPKLPFNLELPNPLISFIVFVKKQFYNLEIIDVSRDSEDRVFFKVKFASDNRFFFLLILGCHSFLSVTHSSIIG